MEAGNKAGNIETKIENAKKAIIELKNISFETQGVKVINNISCKFERGKTYALIGASGSGKSSLLKISAGLILPSEGTVEYNGADISRMNKAETKAFRVRSAFVFQDSALWANQSIRQILELPLKFHFPKMSASQLKEKINQAVNLVGYNRNLDIRPAALSMGEKKLIAFARAMLNQPELVFLDECTESLDEFSSKRLLNIMLQMKEEKKTIIFVTHDLNEVKELADYIFIIEKGNLYKIIQKEEINSDKEIINLIKKELGNEI